MGIILLEGWAVVSLRMGCKIRASFVTICNFNCLKTSIMHTLNSIIYIQGKIELRNCTQDKLIVNIHIDKTNDVNK